MCAQKIRTGCTAVSKLKRDGIGCLPGHVAIDTICLQGHIRSSNIRANMLAGYTVTTDALLRIHGKIWFFPAMRIMTGRAGNCFCFYKALAFRKKPVLVAMNIKASTGSGINRRKKEIRKCIAGKKTKPGFKFTLIIS